MSSPFLSLLEKETVASFLSLVPVVAGWKGTAPVALEEEKKSKYGRGFGNDDGCRAWLLDLPNPFRQGLLLLKFNLDI
jgi:hypothetical protein